MKLTKLDQSGILLEQGSSKLLIDPVHITTPLPPLADVAVLVITHKHIDHFRPEIVTKIVTNNPNIRIFTTADASPDIPGATIVSAGESIEVADFTLQFFGADHAAVLEGQIPCANIGVLVNGTFAHPGDSFDPPPSATQTLAVPISGPWLKASESVAYIQSIKPQTVIPIHDALLSPMGLEVTGNWLRQICADTQAEYKALTPGESLESFL